MAKLPHLSDLQKAGYPPLSIQERGRQKLPSESTKFPKFVTRQSLHMSHTAFGEFFPEIADKETRVVTVIDQAIKDLPLGAYALIDLYCTDPDCDCRNVYIHVVHEEFPGPIATITYGWENLTYYKEWMGGGDDDYILTQFKGPALAIGARQSQFAGELLRIFEDILQTDKEYANRLQRHYRLVKGFIKNKNLR